MRILLINKYLHRRGGPETWMFRHAEYLRNAGHEVAFFAMDHPRNDASEWSRYFVSNVELRGEDKPASLSGKLRTAGRFLYSTEARRKLSALLDEFHPDVAICNNIYHQISPSILPLLKRRGVRTLLFLRDYKLVCPNYELLAPDGVCERCIGGHFMNAVRHRCVGGSRAESALCAFEGWFHRLMGFYRRADVLVSPSRFLIEKVRQDPKYRSVPVAFLPNAVETREDARVTTGGYALFVGLLVPTKGVDVLIRAAALLAEHSFRIVGDGPESEALKELAVSLGATNVTFAGRLGGEALADAYRGAACLVMPSVWYENCPNVIIEAASHAKASVVSDIGGMAELVDDSETGLHFRASDPADLAAKLGRLLDDQDLQRTLNANAHAKMLREWSLERHYEGLMALLKG
jgi:glycosyltransferase involved in cell wall biosynthesis